MAGSDDDMDDLIAQFMDITMCDSRHAAANHLSSCRGSLDDALALYFAADDEPVRPPIPTRTERLYGDDDDHGHLMATPPPPPPVPVVRPPMPVPARTESFFQDAGYLRAVLGNSNVVEEEDGDAASDYGEAAEGEDACTVRVSFPDGQVVQKDFGAARPVEGLFRYCHRHSVSAAGGGRRAFRLVQFAGAASEEIRRGDATFQQLGLHCWTLHLLFGLGPRAHSDGH
uniref:UBX domain-containing protein n=1 Tax=Oryza meridionalis TaxID=40149 RepID=A0A0E0CL83_9ORYZ